MRENFNTCNLRAIKFTGLLFDLTLLIEYNRDTIQTTCLKRCHACTGNRPLYSNGQIIIMEEK